MDDDGHTVAGKIPKKAINPSNADEDDGSQDDEAASAATGRNTRLSRKRTKTGCLTCRRRRIKCGEERPTCGNCIKSKRQCEGYNQRVIFKDPLNSYRGPMPISTTSAGFGTQSNQELSSVSGYRSSHDTLPISPLALPNIAIAPKPITVFPSPLSTAGTPLTEWPEQIFHGSGVQYGMPSDHADPAHLEDKGNRHQLSNVSKFPNYDENFHRHPSSGPLPPYGAPPVPEREPLSNMNPMHSHVQPYAVWPDDANRILGPVTPDISYHPESRQSTSESASVFTHRGLTYATENSQFQLVVQTSSIQPVYSKNEFRQNLSDIKPPQTAVSISHGNQKRLQIQQQNEIEDRRDHKPGQILNVNQQREYEDSVTSNPSPDRSVVNIPPPEFSAPLATLANNKLDGDGDDADADGCSDMSIDEMNMEEYDYDPEANFGTMQHNRLVNNDLGIVVAVQAAQDRKDLSIRTYRSFISGFGSDMLATYIPSSRSSPLKDSTTARIFCHFINVLGPSISMYERHPANPSLMFQGVPVPKNQQHLWSYTMPTLALANEALLHSILALATLHIAKLQSTPITASLRHYHIAIRRVARSVRLPTRRGQPATLAATLLLGFYEVMSAELDKWSNHLLGAKQLLKEIDFAGVARYLKTKKMELQNLHSSSLYHREMALGTGDEFYKKFDELSRNSAEDDLDENLVGMIMGKKIKYDQYGQIIEDSAIKNYAHRTYTHRDLEIYENQRDLFWWFAKQDAVQSILSGNRLFLEYDLWSHCPPRAPVGRRDAIYGTFDHLILLLGRVTDFAAKDLKRKKRVMKANGGQWRPPPGMQMPAPMARRGSASHKSQDGPPFQPMQSQMPPFAGMVPQTAETTLPRGFSPINEDSPKIVEDDRDLRERTLEAEEEWHEIRSAFDIIGEKFGPDFQSLGPEYSQTVNTPFGPALQYRTYSIAGIWMTYYAGLIVCHRSHPSMPPTVLMAAGIAAQQTASYANELGRIAAGIAPDAEMDTQVNIGVGSGLMESSLALFVAGVQVQNPLQRAWIVQRLLDVARLTGWETASKSAAGCEAAWVKAAEMGRGPPYTRKTAKPQAPVFLRSRLVDSSEDVDEEKFAIARTDRVQYAMGLLGQEEELKGNG